MPLAAYFLSSAILLFASSCNQNVETKDTTPLQREIDSLKNELNNSQKLTQTLSEVSILMDSIDASRSLLRLHMVEGASENGLQNRLHELNSYIRTTQARIEEFEKEARKSKASLSLFNSIISKLKSDIQIKTRDVVRLQDLVNQYQAENEDLLKVTKVQEAKIVESSYLIKANEHELSEKDAKIAQLEAQSRLAKAEAYFKQAEAFQEVANRTRFSPRRKKAALIEALNLYKESYSYGKLEAKDRINQIENQLDK